MKKNKIKWISIFFMFFIILGSVLSQEEEEQPSPPIPSLGDGELISLELKNIDVVEVIKILSRKGKLNVVVGPNVKGRITMFLNDVSLMDALLAVLESSALAYVKEDGIMKIMTDREFEATYGREFYDNKQMIIIPVSHANAGEVAASLSKLKPKATIIVDERTNSILVKDAGENIDELKQAVSEMDKTIVTQNYKVKHLSQKQAEELIKMLLGKKGTFYFNSKINQVVIRDFPENVKKINTLLEAHDIPTDIITKAFELDYAKFDSVEAKLKQILTPDVGTIIADERTNKLLVSDLKSNFDVIERLVAEYDQKDRQVLIEAKIVQVLLNDRFKWGINWRTVIDQLNKSNLGLNLMSAYEVAGDVVSTGIGFAKSVKELSQVPDQGKDSADTTTTTITTDIDADGKETSTTNKVRTITESNELQETDITPFNSNIAFPSDGGARVVAVGSIDGRQFEGVLNALKMVGDTKVLSSPRIITLHNEAAKIQVASKEAYVTSTTVVPGSGPSTTSENVTFLDVGITLDVTPQINKQDFITLKVKPSVSSVTSTVTTASGNRIPIVSTQEVESKIQVKDGTTIVLGGLHEQFTDKAQSRVPFLGAIPLIGVLFKKIDNRVKNSELVMFLTPHIMTGDKSFYESEEQEVSKDVKEFLKEKEVYQKARDYELNKESWSDK